jgi:hypothetical protein
MAEKPEPKNTNELDVELPDGVDRDPSEVDTDRYYADDGAEPDEPGPDLYPIVTPEELKIDRNF